MSKWKAYNEEIIKLLPLFNNTNIAEKLLIGGTYKQIEQFRRYVSIVRGVTPAEGNVISRKNKDIDIAETETVINDYEPKKTIFTAIGNDGKIMDIEKYCKHWGLDHDKVRSFKLVSHTGIPFYNIAFYEKETEENKEIDFESIFKDKVKPIEIYYSSDSLPYVANGCVFDRAVISDAHIGMDVNKDGYSLYEGSWSEKEIFESLTVFVNEILKNQKSDTLLLHELGDFLDGWEGYTTRGGHKLPQNMDSQKAFDVGLRFKINLIDALFKKYRKIKVVNICNDNHAGAFGYVLNSAFKTYIELKYPNNIEVFNQRKFIDHYIEGKKCFILTHGKDEKSLKFGFKPKLDPIQIEKIKNYIDEYKLWEYDIEFGKGDSHQLLFDLTSSTAFEYQNFGAISPPSDWVKTNFKNTLRCFTTFNYYESQKTTNNYIF
jgi:hypothetical protein